MIEYLYTEGEKACEKEPLKVRLDGRICGQIEKVTGSNKGYRYLPKGVMRCDSNSKIFDTVEEVQRSLGE